MSFIRRTSRGIGSMLTAAATLASVSPAAHAAIEVNVTHVGFPGVPTGDVIRAGSWIPIIVDVALTNELSFDGTIRVAQPDGDGDECFDEVELHLRSDTGGARRVYLYVPANPRRTDDRFTVEVRNEQGEAVRVVSQGERTFQATPGQQPNVLAEDDMLVLLVSSAAIGRFIELAGAEFRDKFIHPVHLAHISPTDLPEHWIGLDGVDYIIWDDARPEELTPRQLDSLLEWTRQGGTLLIASSRSAGSLKLSKTLEPLLPVELGEVIGVENLSEVRGLVLDPPTDDGDVALHTEWTTMPFAAAVPIVRCTKRGHAQVIAAESSLQTDVFVRGRLGAGRIIFAGVVLQDFFSAPGKLGKFFTHVLWIRPSENLGPGPAAANSLYDQVVSAVAFATSSGLYLLTAGAFSILYALAATFGTWKVLSARGWRQHSWSAFALVAVLASVASLMMVGWMHGFGDRLHQIAIVDADAGATHGHATAFFGLKTSIDKQIDVWLPSDWVSADEPDATTCFLRPLPEGNLPTQARDSFADPDSYRLVPAGAMIDDVRIRGTLKRFEGRWDGPIGGKLYGQVAIRGGTITEDSYIVNELGATLTNCYLLQPIENIGKLGVGRDLFIYAYRLGDLPSDGSKILLYPKCYSTIATVKEIKRANELEKRHIEWSARFQGFVTSLAYGASSQGGFAAGNEQEALLLVSTVGEFDADNMPGHIKEWGGPQTWSRDRMRRLELREHLHAGHEQGKTNAEPGSVVLVGFARTPGPMRLFTRSGDRDFRPLQPDAGASWTMYRIRIPTTVLAGAATAEEEAGLQRGVTP